MLHAIDGTDEPARTIITIKIQYFNLQANWGRVPPSRLPITETARRCSDSKIARSDPRLPSKPRDTGDRIS